MNRISFLDSEQRGQVGFSFIIDNLKVMTPFGLEIKKKIEPFKDKNSLERELSNLEAVLESIEMNKKALGEIERFFCKVKDIRTTINRLKGHITLDDVELYEVKYFSMLIEELISAYGKLDLYIDAVNLVSLEDVINILDPERKKIATFHIYESYSEDLKEIRTKKKIIEEQIFREKSLEKQNSLKTERFNIVLLEEEEELNIRKRLTEELAQYVELMEENISSIGRLDFLISKAKLALKYNAVKPSILSDMRILFKDIFNPEISEILEKENKKFTSVSIELSSGTTVITGANMGGKSVALKTVVLNLLLGQCGFYVFAREAYIPILEFIYFISDDLQSVSQGLSTFGAEIVKFKQAAEEIKRKNGFIALDEFARGTNPKEGFNLVKSICKYLNIYKSISFVSTHYDSVIGENMVHYQVNGLKNVDFNLLRQKIHLDKMQSIDTIQQHMDYRLEKVTKEQQVPKDALNVAILLGLQEEIVDIAMEYYREDHKKLQQL